MRLAILLASALLAGCAPTVFDNINSPNTFEQDRYDCEVLLGYRGQAGKVQPTEQLEDFLIRGHGEMRACLERKGWRARS